MSDTFWTDLIHVFFQLYHSSLPHNIKHLIFSTSTLFLNLVCSDHVSQPYKTVGITILSNITILTSYPFLKATKLLPLSPDGSPFPPLSQVSQYWCQNYSGTPGIRHIPSHCVSGININNNNNVTFLTLKRGTVRSIVSGRIHILCFLGSRSTTGGYVGSPSTTPSNL